MFSLNRRLHRATFYYMKRGFSSTSCNKSLNNIKEPTTGHSQHWASQFLSKNDDSNDNEEKQDDSNDNEEKQDDNSKKSSHDDNAFIASLFSNKAWLSPKIDWLDDLPSVEAINAKMAEIYPQFTSQFKRLREGYQKMWDFLTMEDFRKIVDEINKGAKDPTKFPEITKDAIVR
jgi:ABC-type Zn2+ transport system substrate-binding protein/surface adhesin